MAARITSAAGLVVAQGVVNTRTDGTVGSILNFTMKHQMLLNIVRLPHITSTYTETIRGEPQTTKSFNLYTGVAQLPTFRKEKPHQARRITNPSGTESKISCSYYDSVLLIHYFNHVVCHAENSLLSFLYTHKHIEPQAGKTYFYSKLSACGQLSHIMDGVGGYIKDNKHEPALWVLKHKELIWLFTKYYTPEELRLFFHPMIDEDVPFKSLVFAHYRKADYTGVLAKCTVTGYTRSGEYSKKSSAYHLINGLR